MKISSSLITILAVCVIALGLSVVGYSYLQGQESRCLQKYVLNVSAIREAERARIMKVMATPSSTPSATLSPSPTVRTVRPVVSVTSKP